MSNVDHSLERDPPQTSGHTPEPTPAQLLSKAIFDVAKRVEDHDGSELIRCLARVVDGKDVYHALGAPGDWGYGRPIGDALAAHYKQPRQPVDEKEKARRIYYQDIVYNACLAIDQIEKRRVSHGTGIVCGTVDTPTTEVQDAMWRIAAMCEAHRKALSEIATAVDPAGDGTITTGQIIECIRAGAEALAELSKPTGGAT